MSVIHSCSLLSAPRSFARLGSASSSTKMSMATMNVGRASAASPTHSRRPALGTSPAVTVFHPFGIRLGRRTQVLEAQRQVFGHAVNLRPQPDSPQAAVSQVGLVEESRAGLGNDIFTIARTTPRQGIATFRHSGPGG